MSPLTAREMKFMRAARDMDIAEKGMNRAQKKMRNAEEGIESAQTELESAQEGFNRAKGKLDRHHVHRARKEDAARPLETYGSSGETVKESPNTVRYRYPSPDETTDTTSPGICPEVGQPSERTNTRNDYRRSGPRPEEFSAPLRDLQRAHRISAQSSQGQSGSGSQWKRTCQPDYLVMERRPPGTHQSSSYDQNPLYRDPSSPETSRRVASPENLPSMSYATETLRPVSSSRFRRATNGDPFRGRSDVPVSERSRYQSKQQTDSAETQQGTLGAYNTTRRKSPHLRGDAIRRPEQSAMPTVRSSQGTERLGQGTTASGASDVTVKAPLTRDTGGSARLSTSQPMKIKRPGPRRKKREDTLGMPDRSTAQDPREGH